MADFDATRELMQKYEGQAERLAGWANALNDEVAKLEELVAYWQFKHAAAEKDAARYRWLLSKARDADDGTLSIEFTCPWDNYNNIDAAIDAAMRGENGKSAAV